jgi:hypothetical protein
MDTKPKAKAQVEAPKRKKTKPAITSPYANLAYLKIKTEISNA